MGNKYKQRRIGFTERRGLMARKKPEITCEVEFTEGAMDRITQAFVDLYYAIKDGIHTGPLPESKQKDKTA